MSDSADRLEQRGSVAYSQARFQEAAHSFTRAAEAFRALGDEIKALEMANNAAVSLLELGEAERAADLISGSPDRFAELGDLSRAAMAYGNLATALEALGRLDEAKAAYQEASRIFAELGDSDLRLHTQKALSKLQLRRGHALEAVREMQGGLDSQPSLGYRARFLRWFLKLPSRLIGL